MDKSLKKIESQVKDKELVELRRMEIVKAAVDLFVQKGFHKTTVREIARKFGMSVGTLYEYIRTKEDILYLVCDYIHSSFGMRVRPALHITPDSVKTLQGAIDTYYRMIDEMQDYLVFLYQETKSLSHDDRKYIFKAEEDMTDIFEEIINRGIEDGSFNLDRDQVGLFAHNIMVLGQMWAFRRWALQKSYTLDGYIKAQSARFIKELTS
jgi:TetR/AcrR family transcriptional regulator, cholesterol catabolism regulator